MLLADLQPASFRGVRFLVPKDTWEEGRNSIKHKYPDASFQYVEDNGLIPPEFKVTAILHGANLPGQLKALRSALTRPGPGTLRHPYFGSQFVMVMGPYRGERQDSDSGVITLEISFAVTGPPIFPGAVSGIAAVVSGLASGAVASMFQAFSAAYGYSDGGASTATRTALSDGIGAIAGALAEAFGVGDDLLAESSNVADEPERLADMIEDALRAPIDDDTITAERLVAGYRDVADAAALVTDEALAIDATTVERDARQAAMHTLGSICEAAAYCCLAESMAARTYKTADAVEHDETDLVARFDALQSRALPADVHQSLSDLMVATSEVLRDRQVRLPRVVDINVVLLPASVLAYKLYDSDERTMTLADLNPGTNPILMNGPTAVLTR